MNHGSERVLRLCAFEEESQFRTRSQPARRACEGGTLKEHAGLDMREVTCGIRAIPRDPKPRPSTSKASSASSAISITAQCEAMLGWQRRDQVHGIEAIDFGRSAAHRRHCQMNVAAFEPLMQPNAAILYEMHLHAGMATPIADQEVREQVLDHVRGGPNAEDSAIACLERASALAKQVSFRE